MTADDRCEILGRTDALSLKPGDKVNISIAVYRRWWQVWLPREWQERQEFVVLSVLDGTPE